MSTQAYEENLESIFAIFDTKQKGYLDIETFSEALEFLQLKFDTDDVDALFFAFDPEETGRINYSRFVDFCSEEHVDESCKAVRQAIVLYVSEFQTHYTDTDDELETMATDDLLSSEFIEIPGVQKVIEGMFIEVQKNGVWQIAQVAEEIFDEAGSVLVTEVENQILMVRNVPEKVRPYIEMGGDETPESGAHEYVQEQYDISDDDGHLEETPNPVADILNAFEDDMYAFEVDMMDGRYREESTQSWEEEDDIALMNAAVNQQIAVEAMNRFQHLVQEQKRRSRHAKSVRFLPDVVEEHRPSLPKEKFPRNDRINSKKKLLLQLVQSPPADLKKKFEHLSRNKKRLRDRENVNILRNLGEDPPARHGRPKPRKSSSPQKARRSAQLSNQSSPSNGSRRAKEIRRPFVRKASPIKARRGDVPKGILKREVIVGVPPKAQQSKPKRADALIMGKPASHARNPSPIKQTKRRAPSPNMRNASPPPKKPAPSPHKRTVLATENKLLISRVFDDSPERPPTGPRLFAVQSTPQIPQHLVFAEDRRRKDLKPNRKKRILLGSDERKIVDSSDLVDEDDEKVSEIILNRARAMNNSDLWQDRPLSDSSIHKYDPTWRKKRTASIDRESIDREVNDILSQRKRLLNQDKLLHGLRVSTASKKTPRTYSDHDSDSGYVGRSSSSNSFERTSKRRTYNESFGSKKEKKRLYNRSVPNMKLNGVEQRMPENMEAVYIQAPMQKRMNGAKGSKMKVAKNGDFPVKRKNGGGVARRRRDVDPNRARSKEEYKKKLQLVRNTIQFHDFLKRVNR